MRAPAITIVTVVRNDADGLAKTAKSILNETSQDIEWLIVDGYSTDGTRELSEDLVRNGARWIQRSPKGIYDAMNTGIHSARGDWVWFINAGDRLLSHLSIDSALQAVKVFSQHELIASPVIYETSHGLYFSVAGAHVDPSASPRNSRLHHQGAVMKREMLIDLGGFRTDLRWTADGELLDRIVRRGHSTQIHTPLVAFEMGGASSKYLVSVLRETNTFRPGFYGVQDFLTIPIKNQLIRLLLDAERTNLGRKVVEPLLGSRNRRIRDYINAIDGNHGTG